MDGKSFTFFSSECDNTMKSYYDFFLKQALEVFKRLWCKAYRINEFLLNISTPKTHFCKAIN